MLRFWISLVARTALGILVILNGQAHVLARSLFPANKPSCCPAQHTATEATATESDAKTCCCECCQESGQTTHRQSTHSSKAPVSSDRSADNDGTSKFSACCPRCPG